MASTRKIGEKIPLAVVGKEGTKVEGDGMKSEMTEEERQTAIQHLNDQLKSLRQQVESLSGTLAKVGTKAGKAVSHGATAATDTVTTTVRTYPFYAVLTASAVAFMLGRLSSTPAPTASDRAYDVLRHRLRDVANQAPGFFDSLRSHMR